MTHTHTKPTYTYRIRIYIHHDNLYIHNHIHIWIQLIIGSLQVFFTSFRTFEETRWLRDAVEAENVRTAGTPDIFLGGTNLEKDKEISTR